MHDVISLSINKNIEVNMDCVVKLVWLVWWLRNPRRGEERRGRKGTPQDGEETSSLEKQTQERTLQNTQEQHWAEHVRRHGNVRKS